jgi:hypothetical protein
MNSVYVWVSKNGHKKIKKIKLDKLIEMLNLESFTQKFFISEKKAKEYKKNEHLLFR